MASFNFVNFSLRPNKFIQRRIVFDGIQKLQSHLNFEWSVYIGFGSIWFTDFIFAHKLLGIDKLVSIENDPIGVSRARFNKPYATVNVESGDSATILPKLYEDNQLNDKPWIVWLDYDSEIFEPVVDDVRSVIEKSPENSLFLITFNGNAQKYGKPQHRKTMLQTLFGDIVPNDLPKCKTGNKQIPMTLANLAIEFMESVAVQSIRNVRFVPAFRVIYKDSSMMITVGGVICSKNKLKKDAEFLENETWKCKPIEPIMTPHLTIREILKLQSNLPDKNEWTKKKVNSLGFLLEENELEQYKKYYREYPTFAQIIT